MNGEGRPDREDEAANSNYTQAKYTSGCCPDCGAGQIGGALHHAPSCLRRVGADRGDTVSDVAWFDQHPYDNSRQRRITPDEADDFQARRGWRPIGLMVVIRTEPGRYERYVVRRTGGGDDG